MQAKVEELRQLGIEITLAELLRKRRGPGGGVGSPRSHPAGREAYSPRSHERAYRTRLSAASKEEILAALKDGTAATELAKLHGCALGTIMNLKRQAGLTRPRGKKL